MHDDDFRQFVSERSPALLRLAYLVCADAATAEDVLQTALVRAYVRWGRIVTNPEAYVRRVIVTVAVDEGRRSHRRRESAYAEPPEVVDPAEPFGTVDARQALRHALKALPPRQRAAVVLRHWVGLEPGDVAQLLGCRPETVRSQTMRGLEKLRAALRIEENAS